MLTYRTIIEVISEFINSISRAIIYTMPASSKLYFETPSKQTLTEEKDLWLRVLLQRHFNNREMSNLVLSWAVFVYLYPLFVSVIINFSAAVITSWLNIIISNPRLYNIIIFQISIYQKVQVFHALQLNHHHNDFASVLPLFSICRFQFLLDS